MLASVIVNRARESLIDPRAVHWSEAELYDYASAAQRAVCNLKPSAYTITTDIPLVAGVAQHIPANGLQLFDIYANTSGEGCRQTGRELLTEMFPQWARATQSSDIEDWMSDARTPRDFLVFPPNDGTGSVLANYGAIPPAVDVSTGSSFVVPDSFDMALWASVMGQALAKNSRRQDLAKSQVFFNIFTGLVSGRMKANEINAPRLDVAERA